MAVASAGLYASLHLAPDRQPRQHPTTLFFTVRMPFLPPNQQLLHPFDGLTFFGTTWVSQYQKGKTSLDLNEARDAGFWDGSGISWTICKQSAPCSRQIATPTPHHSIFTGQMLFLMPSQKCQSTDGILAHRTLIKFNILKNFEKSFSG